MNSRNKSADNGNCDYGKAHNPECRTQLFIPYIQMNLERHKDYRLSLIIRREEQEMNQIEKYTAEKLKPLCPQAEAMEVRAEISNCSYYIVFFATVDGVKKQCYEMIDNGELDETATEHCFYKIAKYVRDHAGNTLPVKLDFIISDNRKE